MEDINLVKSRLMDIMQLNIKSNQTEERSKVTDVLSWSEQDTSEWLIQSGIHASIKEMLRPCDGRLLFKYYLIKKQAPSFFFDVLQRNLKSLNDSSSSSPRLSSVVMVDSQQPNLLDFTHFSKELRKLFDK